MACSQAQVNRRILRTTSDYLNILGSKWKTRRKMITPTFHFKILDQFLEVFNASGDILVDKLSQEVGKPSTDLYPYINLFSLDVICGKFKHCLSTI